MGWLYDVIQEHNTMVRAPKGCICPCDAVHSWCPVHGQPDDGYPSQLNLT